MNFGAMKSQFVSVLNRTDLSDPADPMVQTFFDQSIARCQREMRLPHMERVLDIDTTSDVSQVIVPNDWMQNGVFAVEMPGDKRELEYLELGTFLVKSNSTDGSGEPIYYTRKYDRWLISDSIPAGVTAWLLYYGEETALVNDDDETTLAQIAPDLIIYGALTYAADYFIDDRGSQWEQKWEAFREQIQLQATEGENSTGSNAVAPSADYDDGV